MTVKSEEGREKREERFRCEAPGVIYDAYRYRHETADGETSDVRLGQTQGDRPIGFRRFAPNGV